MSEICRQLQRLRTPPSLDFSKPHLSIDDASDGDDDGGGDDDHGAHAQYAVLGFSKPQSLDPARPQTGSCSGDIHRRVVVEKGSLSWCLDVLMPLNEGTIFQANAQDHNVGQAGIF